MKTRSLIGVMTKRGVKLNPHLTGAWGRGMGQQSMSSWSADGQFNLGLNMEQSVKKGRPIPNVSNSLLLSKIISLQSISDIHRNT